MANEKNAAAIARRAVIETNIERCRDTAAENIVEIGRWLIRAKEEGIVPHGEWTAWVAMHAGMNERTAQRAMQFARELPEGSALARLGTAKISSLLMLPPEEREDAAKRIDAQHATSREVDERVRAIRAERDEALRLVGEQKKRLCEAEKDKQAAVNDAIARTRADVRREGDAAVSRLEELIEYAENGRKQTEMLLDRSREREVQLRRQLEQARAGAQTSPDMERKLQLLEKQLKESRIELAQRDMELDRLSEKLDEAKTEALRSGMADAQDRICPSARILSAVGAFTVEAGPVIGELERTAHTMDEETRQLLISQASLIGQMAVRVIGACGGDADGLL